MSDESEIQAEVEALRVRFTDTKILYREVCGLLFFRFGITPTASKLYQYVRKGSMSAPADALAKFWEELRDKARVQIDHPDLPEALKLATADAVQALWGQATELARTELAAVRLEAQAQAERATGDLEAARSEAAGLAAQLSALQEQLAVLLSEARERGSELAAERRAHAAAAARGQALEQQLAEQRQQAEQIRRDFGAELDKSRAAIEAADERATGAERRALREIEQERSGRVAADKHLDAARTQLAESELRARAAAIEAASVTARLTSELEGAGLALRVAKSSEQTLTEQLKAAQAEATHHRAEAQTLRGLLDQLKPAASRPRSKRTSTAKPKGAE